MRLAAAYGVAMDAVESLNQTVWERKYHVAFIPETREKRSEHDRVAETAPSLRPHARDRTVAEPGGS